MKRFSFKLPIYDINITLVQIEGQQDKNTIKRICQAIRVDKEDLSYILNTVEDEGTDGGLTCTNMGLRKAIVFLFPFTSLEEKINTFDHEKRHLEDRILKYFKVEDIESAGMLAGFLGWKFYQFQQK